MSQFKVYCLKDPRNEEVRYIGITSQTLKKRLQAHHWMDKRINLPKYQWLQELKTLGLKVIIEEIETVEEEYACFSEEFWIKSYRDNGADLFNLTNGGYGVPGLKFSPEVREKMSLAAKGKKKPGLGPKVAAYNRTRVFSPETRKKITEANIRYWANPETRDLAISRMQGRKFSEEAKAALSIKRKKEWTPERCEAIREFRTGENNGRAKLNWLKVREIRANSTSSVPELAREFGVTVETIRHIKKNIIWKE